MKENEIKITNAPDIEGLLLRRFAGDSDYPNMVEIIDRASEADQDDNAVTLEDIKHSYAHFNKLRSPSGYDHRRS